MRHSLLNPSTEQARRWVAFSLVGGLGVCVQTTVLALLTGMAGWSYLPATALAVEIAVLHNFIWHEQWTWASRADHEPRGMIARLMRFNVANGSISIAGNVGFMTLYVVFLAVPLVPATLLAIATTSLANFLIADRWVFRTSPARVSAVALLVGGQIWMGRPAMAADLKPETVAAWDR